MKKLMIAAAVAAMGVGAFAGVCEPTPETCSDRAYQMQLNVYTTKGKIVAGTATGSVCAPGESPCVVWRGKDKTVIRGYLYTCTCTDSCDLKEYKDAFCDARRHALFNFDGKDLTDDCLKINWVHAMGANITDAEIFWNFAGTVAYDEKRVSKYDLQGAGYGTFNKGYFDSFSGYFAGTVDATYDLSIEKSTAAIADCVCAPSMVVLCGDAGEWVPDTDGSVAFGAWKLRYNATISKAIERGTWNALTAIKKAMAH